jgi:hypothetical protein
MPLNLTCPACGQSFPAVQRLDGQVASCPVCRSVFEVPGAKTRWRLPPWLPIVAVVAAVVVSPLAFALCWRSLPPEGAEPEDRSYPRRPEEERVAAFILGAAKKPKAVQFLRWGPHMPGKELTTLFSERGVYELQPTMYQETRHGQVYILRVCFTDPNDHGFLAPLGDDFAEPLQPPSHVHDRLYILFGLVVHPLRNNLAGDQWKQYARQNIGQLAMSIHDISGRNNR